jgi:hypothetical protein
MPEAILRRILMAGDREVITPDAFAHSPTLVNCSGPRRRAILALKFEPNCPNFFVD